MKRHWNRGREKLLWHKLKKEIGCISIPQANPVHAKNQKQTLSQHRALGRKPHHNNTEYYCMQMDTDLSFFSIVYTVTRNSEKDFFGTMHR